MITELDIIFFVVIKCYAYASLCACTYIYMYPQSKHNHSQELFAIFKKSQVSEHFWALPYRYIELSGLVDFLCDYYSQDSGARVSAKHCIALYIFMKERSYG